MNIQISPLQPKEYSWVNALLDQEKRFAYLPDAFSLLWNFTPDGVPKVLWSIRVDDELVGSAGCVLMETDRAQAAFGLIIAPRYRRQGIGTQVYNALLAWASQRRVQWLSTRVYTHQVAGLSFLAKQGFRDSAAAWLGQLHIATVDPAAWADPDTLVADQGLRFTTLDRLPFRGLAERLLPLWNRTRPDQPQDWPYLPYSVKRFAQEMLEPETLALEHSYALVTAEQQVVALTLNTLEPMAQGEQRAMRCLFTVYSAVDPAFRRRGLGAALKVKVLLHAKAHHIDFLVAENDERNIAMGQLNQRLGYRRLADLVTYRKTVGQ